MRYVLEALSRHHTVDALVIRHAEQAYVERMGTARILRVPLHDNDLNERIETFRRALKRQLEGAEYDIVHVRDGWAGTTVLDLRELLRYRVVFDAARAPMADAPLMDETLSAELGRAEQRCLLQAERVLVPTEDARGHLLGIRGGGVHVVPPGVDVDQFDWDEPQLGIPIVLFAGTIEPGRGVRVLLSAMTHVLRAMDAKLILAGTLQPEFRANLEMAIHDLGLTGRVDLHGEVDHGDMPELIARATVCVAPSASESRTQPMALYPTKILEYMACRRAVVAPRRGTTNMLIRNAAHGLLFAPGDPEDLARNIISALRDHDLRGRMANAGYQLVRQFHTASSTRRILRQLYRELTLTPAGTELSYSQVITDRTPKVPLMWNDPREITETNNIPTGLADSLPDEGITADLDQSLNDRLADRLDNRLDNGLGDGHTLEEAHFTGLESDSITPVNIAAAPSDTRSTIEIAFSMDSVMSGETDETELPAAQMNAMNQESDDWIVPEWDSQTGWKSLLDPADEGTPLDGVHIPPDVVLGGRFAAGEISVDTPRPELLEDDEPSFTAVSVLLGTYGEDPGHGGSK